MCAGDKQLVDKVFFLDLCGCLALATAALGYVSIEWLRLGVTGMRQCHDHVFLDNEVLDGQVFVRLHDLGTTLVAVALQDLLQLFLDDLHQAFRT